MAKLQFPRAEEMADLVRNIDLTFLDKMTLEELSVVIEGINKHWGATIIDDIWLDKYKDEFTLGDRKNGNVAIKSLGHLSLDSQRKYVKDTLHTLQEASSNYKAHQYSKWDDPVSDRLLTMGYMQQNLKIAYVLYMGCESHEQSIKLTAWLYRNKKCKLVGRRWTKRLNGKLYPYELKLWYPDPEWASDLVQEELQIEGRKALAQQDSISAQTA